MVVNIDKIDISTPIENLDLPEVIKSSLKSIGLVDLEDILENSEQELMKFPDIAKLRAAQIREIVENHGYQLLPRDKRYIPNPYRIDGLPPCDERLGYNIGILLHSREITHTKIVNIIKGISDTRIAAKFLKGVNLGHSNAKECSIIQDKVFFLSLPFNCETCYLPCYSTDDRGRNYFKINEMENNMRKRIDKGLIKRDCFDDAPYP